MQQFYKIAILTVCLFINNAFASATPTTLRIAILDNFQVEPLGAYYQHAYIEGMETAVLAAKKQGIKIVYKTFWFGASPLDILKKIPEVKAWHPDLILGPHSSSKFLLLRNQFTDVMTLSLYASDEDLEKLPNNFYSLCPSDLYFIKTFVEVVNEKFLGRGIFAIVQSECKECVDSSELFFKGYKKLNPNANLTKVISAIGDVEEVNIKNLFKEYKYNDLILVLTSDFYTDSKLSERIAEQLGYKNLVFFSIADNWGGQRFKDVYQTNSNYQLYRIGTLLINNKSNQFRNFARLFSKLYKAPPQDTIAYMSYLGAMSAVEALQRFQTSSALTTRERVLLSFGLALKNDPNWFKTSDYALYKLSSQGENKITSGSMLSSKPIINAPNEK